MTWQQYMKVLFPNEKTAQRYTKLGNTLLRKSREDREKHILNLSRSSQIVYRTALKHVEGYEKLFKKNSSDIWKNIDPATRRILEANKPILFSQENTDESLEELRIQQKARFFQIGEEMVLIPNSIVKQARKANKTYLYQ